MSYVDETRNKSDAALQPPTDVHVICTLNVFAVPPLRMEWETFMETKGESFVVY